MQCPACENQLKKNDVAGVNVDVCENGCGGIWFDNFELEKIDEQHDQTGQMLLEVTKNPSVNVDYSEKRKCPVCDNIVMMRHFSSVQRNVEVDECGVCGGIWLDDGELATICKQYGSDEERKKAAEEYFDELFGEKFAAMEAQEKADLQETRNAIKAFRFICPSYYIPGTQNWGAF